MTDTDIIDGILKRESGRYTHRASDMGGPTKWGITQDTLSDELGRPAKPSDVAALTESMARTIYQRRYVAPFSWVTQERLRVLLIDYAVNSGVHRAVVALQRALRVPADGIPGPETKAALGVRSAGPYREVLADRFKHYADVVLADPKVAKFRTSSPDTQLENLRGWINRGVEFL